MSLLPMSEEKLDLILNGFVNWSKTSRSKYKEINPNSQHVSHSFKFFLLLSSGKVVHTLLNCQHKVPKVRNAKKKSKPNIEFLLKCEGFSALASILRTCVCTLSQEARETRRQTLAG